MQMQNPTNTKNSNYRRENYLQIIQFLAFDAVLWQARKYKHFT